MKVSNEMKDIKSVTDKLRAYCENMEFKGWDPYDALNSSILQIFSFNNKYLRAGFTQLFRRLPVNIRPLVGIRKGYNPKGIGLFLESYSKFYAIDKKDETLKVINELLQVLVKTKSTKYKGNSWGYNFPWQSRVVYKPRWTPTIVNTAFIGHALLTCYEITGIKLALELALKIPEFILTELNILQCDDGTIAFSYSPVDEEYVHNANMLGASILLRLGKVAENAQWISTAHKSIKHSLNRQNPDGSWFFEDRPTHQWIDSFHTGFKLESIRWFIEFNEGSAYIDRYNKGVAFYRDNFFLEDGTPKYYHNKVYPIDIHAPAEAIYFFSGLKDERSAALVEKVLQWTLQHMVDDKGYFYFRINKSSLNKISYMRWTQSWAMRGLSEYLYRKQIN